MGMFVLLRWKRHLFAPVMLLHYLGAAVILALREDWDHFFFVEGRHPWLIALPLILYFAGQLGLWIAFVLGSADSSARRKREMTAVLAGFTAAMLGMTVLWSHMKGLYLAHSSSNTHYNLGFALAQRDNYDGAIAEYRKAIALEPDDADARYNLDRLLRVVPREKDAADETRQTGERRDLD
jgi:tetratricopeptide (TPR) repeat protein